VPDDDDRCAIVNSTMACIYYSKNYIKSQYFTSRLTTLY
jgi:hypothetical protein